MMAEEKYKMEGKIRGFSRLCWPGSNCRGMQPRHNTRNDLFITAYRDQRIGHRERCIRLTPVWLSCMERRQGMRKAKWQHALLVSRSILRGGLEL
jgi:hypothetical protein